MNKGPLFTLSVCIGLPLCMALGMAWYANSAGMLSIEVRERGPHGDDVQIHVPGWFIQPAMELIPTRVFGSVGGDSEEWLPLAEALIREIDRCPDAVFVTVDSDDEHVRIEKKGRQLIIHVDSEDEVVNIKVPAPLARSALRMVARAAARRGRGSDCLFLHSDSDVGQGRTRL